MEEGIHFRQECHGSILEVNPQNFVSQNALVDVQGISVCDVPSRPFPVVPSQQ